ncbi:MAG: hypothetical protein JWO67_2556 [Streptosporangiaceae bacterium]|nr:hypothetical protein [Streptosporangiaceae bacterium]
MAEAWLPPARRIETREDGGPMQGGAPRAVWLTSGTDPREVSALSVAQSLARENRPPHLVWNPCTGDVVQLVPMTRAAGLLTGHVGREGRVCAQIMVVGQPRAPFTHGPLACLEPIMSWLDRWGVPRRWPAGPPLPSPQAYHSPRNRRPWARGGHFGLSQVPGAEAADPGGIDIRRITGPETPVAEIPRPRPAPIEEMGVTALPARRLTRPPAPVAAPAPEPARIRT